MPPPPFGGGGGSVRWPGNHWGHYAPDDDDSFTPIWGDHFCVTDPRTRQPICDSGGNGDRSNRTGERRVRSGGG